MKPPVLDFSTLAPERPKIRIDGVLYEMSILSDFGLAEQSRLARLMKEGAELQAEIDAAPPPAPTGNADADAALASLGAITESHAERVLAVLDEAVEMIVRAPREVLEKLSEFQKRQVCQAFTPTVIAATPATGQGRRTTTSRSTSASSSRSSRRRTASVPG